jgi:hypothetical protein
MLPAQQQRQPATGLNNSQPGAGMQGVEALIWPLLLAVTCMLHV